MKAISSLIRPMPLVRASRLGFRWHQDCPLLSRELEAALIDGLSHIVEGEIREGSFLGTTLFSIDLHDVARRWRGSFDDECRQDLLEALKFSVRFRLQLMRIARSEVTSLHAEKDFKTALCETSFRFRSPTLLCVDMDIEVPLAGELASAQVT